MSKLSLVLNLELYFVYEQDCILGSAYHCANYSFSTAFDNCLIDKKMQIFVRSSFIWIDGATFSKGGKFY